MKDMHYPDFPYDACELGAYVFSIDKFIISIKGTKKIIKYSCEDPQRFEQWLLDNGVKDANKEIG